MRTLLLLCALFLTGCGWEHEYSLYKTAPGVVTDKYHRAAHSSYHPKIGNMPARWTHHPAVWRTTVKCSSLPETFELRGRGYYDRFYEGQKVIVGYRECWDVKRDDNGKELEREFDSFELESVVPDTSVER